MSKTASCLAWGRLTPLSVHSPTRYLAVVTQGEGLTRWPDYTGPHHIVSCGEKISWSHGKIDQTIDSCFQPWQYLQLTWYSSDRNLLETEVEPDKRWAVESFSKLYRWCPSTRSLVFHACACDSSYRENIFTNWSGHFWLLNLLSTQQSPQWS